MCFQSAAEISSDLACRRSRAYTYWRISHVRRPNLKGVLMRKPFDHQPLIVSLCALLCLLFSLPAHAQSGNLLQNPGFEQPFATFDGQPPRQVASGWTPWHVSAPAGSPSFFNAQPEYMPTAPNAARIRSGNDAQTILSFFATHHGGVYQRVTGVTPGTTLRFTVYAYVWSSTFDNVNLSEGDGDVLVSVGIDPTGGTNGQSAAIVWSTPVEQYDAYNAYTVQAAAASSAVTVFVRTTVGVPVKHNNIYLDDASLVVIGSAPTVPTATATRQPPTATNTPVLIVTPPAPTATPTLSRALPGFATPTVEVPKPTNTPLPVLPTITLLPPTPTPLTPIGSEFPYIIIHTVRRGDTVSGLATRYGSTVQAIAVANGLTGSYLIRVGQQLIVPVRTMPERVPTVTPTIVFITATPPAPVPSPGSYDVYTVKPGDTLTRIAQLFSTTVQTLAQLNGIVNVNRIQVGQRLIVPSVTAPPQPSPPPPPPAPVLHVVRPGETLNRIAIRYGRTVWDIARANNIQNINLIYAGQVLLIP